jgi:hypothetical protein
LSNSELSSRKKGAAGYVTSTVAMQPLEKFSLEKERGWPFASATSFWAAIYWR